MTSAEATTSNEASANGSLLRVGDLEHRAAGRRPSRGGLHLRRRGVDCMDAGGCAELEQRLGEDAGAAADIEPACALRRAPSQSRNTGATARLQRPMKRS